MLSKNLVSQASRIYNFKQESEKYSRPDSGTISAINSIKMNPKFAKLLRFSLNCLMGQTILPNNKHRDNARYVFSEHGFEDIIASISNHHMVELIVQYAAGVLNRTIGIQKYREDHIAAGMIENNILAGIYKVQTTNFEMTSDTIKQIIALLANLTLCQQLLGRISQEKVFQGTVAMLRQNKAPINDIKKALQDISHLVVIKSVQRNLDAAELAFQVFLLLLEDDSQITTECMKVLILLTNPQDLLDQIKEKRVINVEQLVQFMNKNKDNDLNTLGAKLLIRIIMPSDIEKALNSLKLQDDDADFYVGLLAALIMAEGFIDKMIEENTLIQDLLQVLRNAKKILKKNKGLVQNCLIALGRIADVSYEVTQKMVSQGLVVLCLDLLEISDTEITSTDIETLRKIGMTYENNYIQFIQLGCIEKIMKHISNNIKDGLVVEAGLQFLLSATIETKAITTIISNKGVSLTVKILENHNSDRPIMDINARLMYVLAGDDEGHLVKKDVLGLIVKFISKRPLWINSNLFYLKTLNLVTSSNPEAITILQKIDPLLALISLMSGKPYTTLLIQIHESRAEKDNEDGDDEELDEELAQEIITEAQRKEIRFHGTKMISKLITKQDIQLMAKEIVDTLAVLTKIQDDLTSLNCEISLVKLAYSVLEESLAQVCLKESQYLVVQQVGNTLIKMNDFTEKKDLQSTTFVFWAHFSQLFWDLLAKDNYKQKKITYMVLEYFNQIIEKTQQKEIIVSCLQSMIEVGGGKKEKRSLQLMVNKKNLLDIESQEDQKQYAERILSCFQNILNKYLQEEDLQLLTLEAIRVYLNFEVFEELFLDGGLARLIINRLEEETTSKAFGIKVIQVLYPLAQKSKTLFIKIEQMKALQNTLAFVMANKYDLDVREAVQSFLLLMSSNNFELFFTKEMQKSLLELIKLSNPSQEKFLLDQATDMMDTLSVYSTVDKVLTFELANQVVNNILALLDLCQNDPEYEPNHCDHIISSSSLLLIRLVNPSSVSKTQYQLDVQQLLKGNIVQKILKSLEQRAHSRQPAPLLIHLLASFTLNSDFSQSVLHELEESEVMIEILIDLLDEYQYEEQTIKDITTVLFTNGKKSTKIAAHLGQKKFIKRLIKSTKIYVLFDLHTKGDQIIKNLNWLINLAEIKEAGIVVYEEGGIDLCMSILKHELSIQKKDVTKRQSVTLQTMPSIKSLLHNVMRNQIANIKKYNINLEKSMQLLDSMMGALQQADLVSKFLTDLKNERIPNLMVVFQQAQQDRQTIKFGLNILKVVLLEEEVLFQFQNLNVRKSLDELQSYYSNDQEMDEHIQKVLLIFRNSQSVLKLKKNYLLVADQVIENYSDLDVVHQLKQALGPLIHSLKGFDPENNEEHLLDSTKLIKLFESQLVKSLQNLDLLISIIRALQELSQESQLNSQLIIKSQIPKIILIQIMTESYLRNLSVKYHSSVVELIEQSFKLINLITPKWSQEVRVQNINDFGQEKVTWNADEIKNSNQRYNNIWPNGVTSGQSKLEMIEVGVIENKSFYEPVMIILAENEVIEDNKIQAALQFTQFIQNGAHFEPLIFSRIFSNSQVAEEYTSAFLENFVIDNENDSKNALQIKLGSRIYSAWVALELGFNKVSSNNNYGKLLNSFQHYLSNTKELDDPHVAYDFKCVDDMIILFLNQFNSSHHNGELADTQIVGAITKFLDYIIPYLSNYKQNQDVKLQVQGILRTLYFLSRDLSLSRCLTENQFDQLIANFSSLLDIKSIDQKQLMKIENKTDLQKISVLEQNSQAAQAQGLLSLNTNFNDQKAQYIAHIMTNLNRHRKTSEMTDLLNLKNSNNLIKSLLNDYSHNPYICLKALQTVENSLLSFEGQFSDPQIDEIQLFIKKAQQLEIDYPEIKIFQQVAKNLSGYETKIIDVTDKDLALTSIDEILAPPQSLSQEQPQDVRFSRLSMQTFQDFEGLRKMVELAQDSEDKQDTGELDIEQLIQTLLIMSQNQDQSLKIVNMGMIETILKIENSKSLSVKYKKLVWELISLLCYHPKVIRKLLITEHDLYKNLKKKLATLAELGAIEEDIAILTKFVLETAGQVSQLQASIKDFSNGDEVKHQITIIKNNQQYDIILNGIQAILKQTVQPEVCDRFYENGGLELLKELYERFGDDHSIRKSLDKIIGCIAKTQEIQNHVFQLGLLDTIIKGVIDATGKENVLIASGCGALSSLAFNNDQNTQHIIQAQLISKIKTIKEEDLTIPVALSVCLLYTNLSNQSDDVKNQLGDNQAIEHLIRIFRHYSQQDYDKDVLVQCLQALCSLACQPANSELVAKYMFGDYLGHFINNHQDEKGIIQLGLEVIQIVTTLISQIPTADQRKENLFIMMSTEQTLEALKLCLTFSEQDKIIIVSALVTLTYLVSNQEIATLFFKIKAELKALRLIKMMTHDKDISYFSLRLLNTALKYDISKTTLYMELLVPLDMKEMLRTHNESGDIFTETLALGYRLIIHEPAITLQFFESDLPKQLIIFADSNQLNQEQQESLFDLLLAIHQGSVVASNKISQDASLLTIKILRQQDNCSEIIEKGLQLLNLYVMTPEGRNQIYSNKGIEICVSVLGQLEQKEQVALNCLNVIQLFGTEQEEYRQSVIDGHLSQLKEMIYKKLHNALVILKLKQVIDLLTQTLKPESKITPEMKTFLTVGTIMKMFTNFLQSRYDLDGARTYKRFYMNDHLTELLCRHDKAKMVKPKWRLTVMNVAEIRENMKENPKQFKESAFDKVSFFTLAKQYLKKKTVDPSKCFSIIAVSGTKPKSLNAYCANIQEKRTWVKYLDLVIAEKEQLALLYNNYVTDDEQDINPNQKRK